MDIMEKVRQRRSVRSYDGREVGEEVTERLRYFFTEYGAGPFGTAVRFELLDLCSVSHRELRSLGTYGMIRGASLFILGAVRDIPGAQVDLGYCLEKVILEATAMGLGSCWMGGTFRRGSFARWMRLADDELLPVITPLGYPAENKTVQDRLVHTGSRSRRRKPWHELFFAGGGQRALTEDEAGNYRNALEAVRLGPSALNRQPWRIIRDREGRYRLYLKEERLYNRALGRIRLQHLDMGIAMSHFELAAREQGMKGWWDPSAPARHLGGLEHIALWVEA